MPGSDPNFSLIGPLVSPSRPVVPSAGALAQVHLACCPRFLVLFPSKDHRNRSTLWANSNAYQPNVDLNTTWSFNPRRRCSCKARNQPQYTPRALARPHSLIRPSLSSPVLRPAGLFSSPREPTAFRKTYFFTSVPWYTRTRGKLYL